MFVNRTKGVRSVNWLDFNGNPVQPGTLNPGESLSIRGFPTHPRTITDGPGNCLHVIDPQRGARSCPIPVPNRAVGSE